MKTPLLCPIALLIATAALAAPPEPKESTATPSQRAGAESHVPTGYRGITGHVYVGEAAPGFVLTSADERKVRLSSLAGDRILLCFTDRREALSEYRAIAESLRAIGVRLVGIARDSPRTLRAQAERDTLSFLLLSDPTGEIAAIYGSYEFATSSIRPGYVLVGRRSIVRMALLGQRLPPEDLLHITSYALAGL